MNAIVLGNGRSGKAASELLRREGWYVHVLDGDDTWPDGIWNLCVTSPGIPLDHRWQELARNSGVRIISELQLGAERFRKLGRRGRPLRNLMSSLRQCRREGRATPTKGGYKDPITFYMYPSIFGKAMFE